MAALTTDDLLDTASAAITQQRPLLESLRAINLRFLRLVQSALTTTHYGAALDLGDIAPLFRSRDPVDLEGISHFPFLLMDLRLASTDTLSALKRRHEAVQDAIRQPAHEPHIALARTALVAGWYAARTEPYGGQLLFGFTPAIVPLMAALPLHEVEALAPLCASPLTIRWRTNPSLWDELLYPGAHKSVDTVRRFVMHAAQLAATHHLK